MSLIQLPAPDLSSVTYGGVVLHLMESYGFSDDDSYLAVRTTYSDNSDLSSLHYAVWLFDIESQSYIANINAQIAGISDAKEIDIRSIQIAGASDDLFVVALSEIKGSGERALVSLHNGEVVSHNLIHSLSGLPLDIDVEHFLLSDNGRFLAVQTSSVQLAADDSPDTNDSSDIYLFDLDNDSVQRVTFVGGSEVFHPAYLKDIYVSQNELKIAFITDAAFVSPTKKDINSGITAQQANQKSDVYIWSSLYDSTGLVGSQEFDLLSVTSEDKAAGFVDRHSAVAITDNGQFFDSASDLIVDGDANNVTDAFFLNNLNEMVRISESDNSDLQAGGLFISASDDGRSAIYLTESPELTGTSQSQQLILHDTVDNATTVISENDQLANNWVISGEISGSAQYVAFTSAADNLTDEEPVADAGSLFLKELSQPESIAITSVNSILVDSDAQPGQVIYYARANNQEALNPVFTDSTRFGVRGTEISIPLRYQDLYGDMQRENMDLKFYFNSQHLSFQDIAGNINSKFFSTHHLIHNDTNNEDNILATDKVLTLSLSASSEFSWVGSPALVDLNSLNFVITSDIAELSQQSTEISFSIEESESYAGSEVVTHQLQIIPYTWDFDLNGEVNALTDGLILLRKLFDMRDEILLDGVVAPNSAGQDHNIINIVDQASLIADIDGDGKVDALTDGLLLLRYLFDISDSLLTEGVISETATRTSAESIKQYIEGFLPSIGGFSAINDAVLASSQPDETDSSIAFSLDDNDLDYEIDAVSGEVILLGGLDGQQTSDSFTVYATNEQGSIASKQVNVNLTTLNQSDGSSGLMATSDIESPLFDSSLDDYFAMRSTGSNFDSNSDPIDYLGQVDSNNEFDRGGRPINNPDFIA